MKRPIFLLLPLSVFLMSGCGAIIENPLVNPVECKSCPELHGVFRISHKSEEPNAKKVGCLHIGSAGEKFPPGFLKIIFVGEQPSGSQPLLTCVPFVAFAEPLGDSYVVHVPLLREQPPKGKALWPMKKVELQFKNQLANLGDKWNAEKIENYLLLRFKKTEAGFMLSTLSNDTFTEQIESKNLSGQVNEKDPEFSGEFFRVTADTAEIRKFFGSMSLDKIFANDGELELDLMK